MIRKSAAKVQWCLEPRIIIKYPERKLIRAKRQPTNISYQNSKCSPKTTIFWQNAGGQVSMFEKTLCETKTRHKTNWKKSKGVEIFFSEKNDQMKETKLWPLVEHFYSKYVKWVVLLLTRPVGCVFHSIENGAQSSRKSVSERVEE